MPETLLPTAMVPGLVTIKDKKGKMPNAFPIDAKELISSGDYELVDNGAVEAARMSATPLKLYNPGVNPDVVVAEVAGPAPMIVAAASPEAAEEQRSSAAGADGTTDQDKAAPADARKADAKQAEKSASQASEQKSGQSAGAEKK